MNGINSLIDDAKILIFQEALGDEKIETSKTLAKIRCVCSTWRDDVETLIWLPYYRKIFARNVSPDTVDVLNHFIHCSSMRALNICAETFPFVNTTCKIVIEVGCDSRIDKDLDIGILFLKYLLKAKVSPERSNEYRQMVNYVLNSEKFSIYNTPQFFNGFLYAFFNRPCVIKSIRFWNLIKEMCPNSKMLDPKSFFTFLMNTRSREYNPEEIKKIEIFFEELLSNQTIEITGLNEIVSEVFFPIVFSFAPDELQYRKYPRNGDQFFLTDLCAMSPSIYSARNLAFLLKNTEIEVDNSIFENALMVSNIPAALELLKEEELIYEVKRKIIENALHMDRRSDGSYSIYSHYYNNKHEIELAFLFLEKMINEPTFKPEYTEVYKEIKSVFSNTLKEMDLLKDDPMEIDQEKHFFEDEELSCEPPLKRARHEAPESSAIPAEQFSLGN